MKYHVMDFIACPSCKHFPLKINSTIEIIEDFELKRQYYQCERYCGKHKIGLTNNEKHQLDCNSCAKKTVIEGFLICENCGMIFLIQNGIPKLIKDELKFEEELRIIGEFSEKFKSGRIIQEDCSESFVLKAKINEMHARSQHDEREIIKNLTSASHQFLKKIEYDCIIQSLEINHNHLLLDNGTGYGIFSIPLSNKCRFVVATDLTYDTLFAFKMYIFKINTEYFSGFSRFPEEKICLIQADSCNLPFRIGFQFDRVICTQVISHIPSSDGREKAFHEIHDYISKNGIFVFTVGNDYLIHKIMRKIRGLSREQLITRSKGVGYYYKFEKHELLEQIDNLFIVERCFGCQSSLDFVLKLSKNGARHIEKVIQNSPLSFILGKIILISCKKR